MILEMYLDIVNERSRVKSIEQPRPNILFPMQISCLVYQPVGQFLFEDCELSKLLEDQAHLTLLLFPFPSGPFQFLVSTIFHALPNQSSITEELIHVVKAFTPTFAEHLAPGSAQSSRSVSQT